MEPTTKYQFVDTDLSAPFGRIRITPILVNQTSSAADNQLFLARSFASEGGLLVFHISGSGFSRSGAGAAIGMNIELNGNSIGQCTTATNESISHKAFVPVVIPVRGTPAGNHNIALIGIANTKVDLQDHFNVTLFEYLRV